MIEIEVEDLVPNMFMEDFNRQKYHGQMSELGLITIKSLLPDSKNIGSRIDYRRFAEEIKLWTYYRTREVEDILKPMDFNKAESYFKEKDKTIAYRLIPILVANRDFNLIEEEIIKNILFSSGNIEDLLEGLLLAKALYMLMEGQDEIEEGLKKYIIGLSQVELLEKYRDSYRIDPSKHGTYPIDFERARISILNQLNGIKSQKFPLLEDLLGILEGKEGKSQLGSIIYRSQGKGKSFEGLDRIYRDISNYIIRLRKSRIEPERLEIKEYNLPDVFSFAEGEVFQHSLLNKSKVIKKEVSNNILTSIIQTKTGMYKFKRDLN